MYLFTAQYLYNKKHVFERKYIMKGKTCNMCHSGGQDTDFYFKHVSVFKTYDGNKKNLNLGIIM